MYLRGRPPSPEATLSGTQCWICSFSTYLKRNEDFIQYSLIASAAAGTFTDADDHHLPTTASNRAAISTATATGALLRPHCHGHTSYHGYYCCSYYCCSYYCLLPLPPPTPPLLLLLRCCYCHYYHSHCYCNCFCTTAHASVCKSSCFCYSHDVF